MDNIFFWLSKLIWLIVKPDTILVILTVIALILLWMKLYQAATNLLSFIVLCLLIISFLPLGNLLINPLETRFQTNPKLPEKIDGIIVLSGAVDAESSRLWQQIEFGGAVERYLMFKQLAQKYPEARLVFTGGSGDISNQKDREADIAKLFFDDINLNSSQLLFERDSRNTYENALFSKELVQPKPNEQWILITSASHIPRSVGVFCKLGWQVIPYPVDHKTLPNQSIEISNNFGGNLSDLQTGIKEWLGLIAYYLFGKTSELFPDKCI